MEILVLEASTTSAKAMLYHTEDRSFEVKVRAYTGIMRTLPSTTRKTSIWTWWLWDGSCWMAGRWI